MLPLPPHFTTTLLKAYLQHFLNLVYQVQLSRKNYKASQKLKTQFEETEQAIEPDMERMLELPDREFKTTVINMLRALIDEVDNMQEYMGNVNRGMEILERIKKKF